MVDEVKVLLRLAWPAILGQLGIMTMGVVDLWIVGGLGKEATAAVGIGNTLSFGTLLLCFGVVHGADPLVSQAFGAQRPHAAGNAAARATVVALALSIPVIAVHLLGDPILRALGQPETVIPLAATYLRNLGIGVLPAILFHAHRQFLQGNGILAPAAWTILVANVVNLAAAWLLVYGGGPIPALGVGGAGLATTLVRVVMTVVLFALTWRHLQAARPDAPIFDVGVLWRTATQTFPVSIQIGLEVWAFNFGFVLAGLLGDTEAAAHTVAMNAASLSFMVPLGVSAAAATRVGNLVGAGRDWRRAGALSVSLGAFVMALSATLFFVFPAAIGRMYNPDPDVVALVATILPIAALFQLFDGTQVVSFGVLRGLGDLRVPALFNVVGYWMVGLPLAVFLVFRADRGLPGLWFGYTAALAIVACLLLIRLAGHARAAVVTQPA